MIINANKAKPEVSYTKALGSAAPTTITPSDGTTIGSVSFNVNSTAVSPERIRDGYRILGVTGTYAGTEVVSGLITISGWANFISFHEAIGKENIMIALRSVPNHTYIAVWAWSINGNRYVAYTKDESLVVVKTDAAISWDSELGKLTITSSGYNFYSGEDYYYVAW